MSYCRIGEDSDVYVVRSGDKWICYCDLACNQSDRPEEMISHLLRHRSFGHTVPQRAIERLNADRFGGPYRTDVEQALEDFWPGLTAPRGGQVES